MANSGIPWIDAIFDWCVILLYDVAAQLGITYEEKGALLEAQQWESEIQRRQALPKNQSKCVCVRFQRYPDKCTLSIEDEGQGFDWSDHLEISPQKLTHSHGRGIALANSISFDSLTYLGKGNQVVGTLLTPPSSAP